MNTLTKFVAVAAFLAAPAASAATFTFDFEGLAANDGLPDPITIGSSTFSVSSTGANDGATIFDTTDATTSDLTGDSDIIPGANTDGVAGNVLILQSSTDGGGLANDSANGGSITFTLLSGPLSFVGASAIDDGTFTFGTSLDGDLASLSLGENETGSETFASSELGIGDSFFITYSGSGAVDALVFDDGVSVVPVPAALPLMLGGMAAFGLVARRRKQRAS